MINTMKAARLYAPGDLRIEEVPVPKLEKNDVLVKISACGICGSDIPRVLTQGTYHFPVIPGHEFGGTIVEAGCEVGKVRIGERVAVIPLIPCRKCKLCEIGQFAQCENYGFLGSRNDGGFAEYVKAPESNTVIVPAGVDDEASALVEPLTVALHVVKNTGIEMGDNIAVFGLGAIGNFVAQWAKLFGAGKVLAMDIDPRRVDIAKQTGLDNAACINDVDVYELIMDNTKGFGVDVAFEASGSGVAFSHAVSVIRTSGKLGLVGRPGKETIIADKTYEKILRSQLTIKGTWSFEFATFPHHAWEQSIDALEKKQIIIDPLITHRIHLDSVFDIIKVMAEKSDFVHKAVIRL